MFKLKPTISLVFSGLFIAFILHSIWNLLLIFQAPKCSPGEVCFASYLNRKPELDLLIYMSDKSRIASYQQILMLKNFNYEEPFERYVLENYI